MKKNTVSQAVLAVIFLTSILGSSLIVGLTSANWVYLPSSPITDKPTITFQSPVNDASYTNNVEVVFTVTKPATWLSEDTHTLGSIQTITYQVDNGAAQNVFTAKDTLPLADGLEQTSSFNFTLTGLTDGTHDVKLTVSADTMYWSSGTPPPCNRRDNEPTPDIPTYDLTAAVTVSFTVKTTPQITITSPQNQSYIANSVPLTFTIDRPVSTIAYSLDGGAQVVADGNITLTGLAYGAHYVVVYADDGAGNTGTSEAVYFNLMETPLTPLPSQSNTTPPWTSPTQSSEQPNGDTGNPFNIAVAAAFAVVFVVVVIAVALISKRMRK